MDDGWADGDEGFDEDPGFVHIKICDSKKGWVFFGGWWRMWGLVKATTLHISFACCAPFFFFSTYLVVASGAHTIYK